jgi:outer membrane receptor protein involved in Fe transport
MSETSVRARWPSPAVPAALLALAVASAPSRADEPAAAPDLTALSLEQLVDLPVVSASRVVRGIGEAPSAVRVITAAEIRDFGWRTLGEALASLPGVYGSYDRSYAYVGARGFLRPGDYNTRFLLLVNGQRINDPVYDQAPVGSDFVVDMDLVERIEFAPGPGSSSYGSNAFFGVINVVTRNGRDYPRGEIRAEADDRNGALLAARYGREGEEGEALLAASGLYRAGEDLYFREFDVPETNDGIAEGRDDERTRRFLVSGSRGAWTISLLHSVRDKGDPAASFGQLFNDPRSNNRDTHTLFGTSYVVRTHPALEWTWRAFAGRYAYDGRFAYEPEPGPLNIDGSRATWAGFGAQGVWTGSERHTLAFGMDAQLDWGLELFNYNDEPREDFFAESADNLRIGLFVEDQFALAQGLLLNSGLRVDRDDIAGVQVSPRLALIRDNGRGTNLKLIAGSAYRSPNLYESGYTRANAPAGADLDLGVERIETLELALSHALDPRTTVSASLFHERLRDLIDEQLEPERGRVYFANLSGVRTRGVEVALDRVWDNGAVLRASYGFANAESDVGGPLENSPRHLAKLNWSTPLPLPRLRAAVEARYVSSRRGELAVVGGYSVVNATVTWPSADGRLELSATVDNLFDRRYADPVEPAFLQNAIVQDGRSVLLRAIFRF